MSATAKLFDHLQGRHPGLPSHTVATIRFDLIQDDGHTEHWYLEISRGEVTLSHSNRVADCVIHANSAVFEDMAATGSSIFAALIRNDLTVQGDMRLFALLRQIIPGPPTSRDPREMYREKVGP